MSSLKPWQTAATPINLFARLRIGRYKYLQLLQQILQQTKSRRIKFGIVGQFLLLVIETTDFSHNWNVVTLILRGLTRAELYVN